jgi:hypothetical protein
VAGLTKKKLVSPEDGAAFASVSLFRAARVLRGTVARPSRSRKARARTLLMLWIKVRIVFFLPRRTIFEFSSMNFAVSATSLGPPFSVALTDVTLVRNWAFCKGSVNFC